MVKQYSAEFKLEAVKMVIDHLLTPQRLWDLALLYLIGGLNSCDWNWKVKYQKDFFLRRSKLNFAK